MRHFEQIGLGANPFPVTPDATRYFLSEKMNVHLTEILHCIDARKGFMLVTADIGLGKTTLTRRLISILTEQKMQVSLVFNSFLNGVELLEAINRDFGVVVNGGIGEQLSVLNDFLLLQFNKQSNVIIILDDAQNLSIESLDLLRQISNLETNEHKLVQILLVAQPEIITTLSYPEIRQLKSRIVLNIELTPYSRQETHDYIMHRLASVDNSQNIYLSLPALKRLHGASGGYPRQINLIMDRALYGVVAQGKNRVTASLIKQAVKDINPIQSSGSIPINYSTYSFAAISALLVLFIWNYFSPAVEVQAAQTSTIISPILNESKNTLVVTDSTVMEVANYTATTAAEEQAENKEEVVRFLSSKAAPLSLNKLQKAITSHYFGNINSYLQAEGWSLLHFDSNVSEQTLKITNAQEQDEWLVLWQLPYEVNTFNFGSESKGVKQLQGELNNLGYYNGEVDGIVGGKTFSAIAQFQRQVGLVPSGRLTLKTRYLLHQAIL